jgi:hypothetical protein
MKRTIITAALILGGMLNAAHADTWIFRDTLRPGGQDRSMAVKRADGRKCGTIRGSFRDGSGFEQCMVARGWVLDHIIPDPPSAHARARGSSSDYSPSVDNSSSDDWVQRQRDQDNTQQMLNTQQMINNQQMQNDQMFQQQQQQMINDMNNH